MAHKRWIFTAKQDELLLRYYDGHPERMRQLYAKFPAWPHWVIRVRARKLGLTRSKEPRWTAAQEQLLVRHIGTMPWAELARRCSRTIVAVKLHSKRMGLRKTKVGLTALSVARLLGCDGHKVTRWIQRGWLAAKSRGTDPHPFRGTIYLITPTALRLFIIAHPEEIDLRRVDKLWFIDLLIGRFEQAGTVIREELPVAPAVVDRLDRAMREVAGMLE